MFNSIFLVIIPLKKIKPNTIINLESTQDFYNFTSNRRKLWVFSLFEKKAIEIQNFLLSFFKKESYFINFTYKLRRCIDTTCRHFGIVKIKNANYCYNNAFIVWRFIKKSMMAARFVYLIDNQIQNISIQIYLTEKNCL